MTNATERFVEVLRSHGSKVNTSGGRYMAQCPAHDDRTPSLGVTHADGAALVTCWAGCNTEDVLDALSLSWADLFDEPRGRRYKYTDANGAVTAWVTRTPGKIGGKPKLFKQAVKVASDHSLFNLPQVIAAVAAGDPVVLVEGERDATVAAELFGKIATTGRMGAGNIGKADFTPLAGATVEVIADQDDAGNKWLAVVLDRLAEVGAEVRVLRPHGNDLAEHATRYGWDELEQVDAERPARRHLTLTRASDIAPRPVRWAWDGRMAAGTLTLIAGREGLGKSTVAYSLAADLTRGRLPGVHRGTAKAVLIVATEDSWAHTIVPRLMAAGADLDLIYRVEAVSVLGTHSAVSLPKDNEALLDAIDQTGAALVLLDPLMSRVAADLDTHRDQEVRQALEPLVEIADNTGVVIAGLIHFNKTGSSDPLNSVMASKAFTAVARTVNVVVKDTDDETGRRRLFATPKSNLGPDDLPLLAFTITGHEIPTAEGPAFTSRIQWDGEVAGDVADHLNVATDPEARSMSAEARQWLADYMRAEGGKVAAKEAVKAYSAAIGDRTDNARRRLTAARRKIGYTVESVGFPAVHYWIDTARHSPDNSPGESSGLSGLSGQGESKDSPDSADSPDVLGIHVSGLSTRYCRKCGIHLGLDRPGRDLCLNCQRREAAA